MEHYRGAHNYGFLVVDCMEMEVHCTGCDLVDIRGTTGSYMLSTMDVGSLGSQEGGRSMFSPRRLRPEFDWSALDWADSVMDKSKEEQAIMTERRPATTIEQLDIHFGYMMAELKDMRERLDHTFTLLASKQEEMGKSHASLINEVNELRARVDAQAPRTRWKGFTEIAIGVTAIAAAFGVVSAIFRYLHL
jgi:hypothetical protein